MTQIVSLAWDGHYRTLVSVFEKLLENSHLVDCTIAAEGQKLKAHKEVLSAFSPYFELLLREEIGNNPTVILSGIHFKDLKTLIDFIYQGKLEISEDRIEDLIDVAQCLQIKGLGGVRKCGSGNTNNVSVLHKRLAPASDIPCKRKRYVEDDEVASVLSKEANVNHKNYSNRNSLPYKNDVDVPTAHLAKQRSSFQNLMPNIEVQNVPSNSNLFSAKSTLSSTVTDNLILHSESLVKTESDSDVVQQAKESMGDSRRDTSSCESIGNTYGTSEDTILGLSTDISVTNDSNLQEDLPPGGVPPGVLNLQPCGSKFTIVSSDRNELDSKNMNLPSRSVTPRVETRNLFHSEFHVKTESNAEDDNFQTEDNEFFGNSLQSADVLSISTREMQVEHNEKHRSDCSAHAVFNPMNVLHLATEVYKGRKLKSSPMTSREDYFMCDMIVQVIDEHFNDSHFVPETDTFDFKESKSTNKKEIDAVKLNEALQSDNDSDPDYEPSPRECTRNTIPLAKKKEVVTFWLNMEGKKRLSVNTVRQRYRFVKSERELYRWKNKFSEDAKKLKEEKNVI